MELQINTIVKVIIILLVVILVAASLFLVWNNYLKPYFEGIGKEVTGLALLKLKQKQKRKF